MRILAADTTTNALTVCLWNDGAIEAETLVDCGRTHTERLIDTVDWVLAQACASLNVVDVLAVSRGPGSFTGVRVGIAAMKGLALAEGLPLVGVSTLDAMSRLCAIQNGVVCPVLDAKMSEVFGAVYRVKDGVRDKLTPDRVCPIETLLQGIEGAPLFLGDGAILYAERIRKALPEAILLPHIFSLPRASTVAMEAAELLEQGISTNPDDVMPVYLRKSQAEENFDRAQAETPSQ